MTLLRNINNPKDVLNQAPTQALADKGYVPVAMPDTSRITADSLTSSNPITYVTPRETPIYPIDKIDTSMPAMTATPSEQKASDLTTRLRELNDLYTGQSSFRAEQEKAQGVEELVKTQNDLISQLKAIQNESKAIPLKSQEQAKGRGITAGGLAPIETAALRNNAIQALTTNSLLEASRGNIATAQTLIDRAVSQKFDPIKEQIDATIKNLDLILKSPEYSLEDKNRAQAQLDIQNAKKAQLEQQQTDQKLILSTATEAAKNGADSLTLKRISEATSPMEAQTIWGEYVNNKNALDAQAQAQAEKTDQENKLALAGYNYVATPAERDRLKAQGYEILQQSGRTYAKEPEPVTVKRGSGRGSGGGSTPITSPDGKVSVPGDETSQSILSQTGLSIPAFAYLTQGTTALTRMTADERLQYMHEAESWANKNGIDLATFGSQYKAYNEALQSNIQRVNNVKVAEGELEGTLENLSTAADEASFASMKWANVAKLFAGQEFNDENVSKYAFHLNQLRSELALYNAAAAGKGQTDDSDYQEAERIIKDGFAAGSITGFQSALKNSVSKMDMVLGKNLDRTNRQIWDLFGVGNKYTYKTIEPQKVDTTPAPKSPQGFWAKVGNWLWGND